MAKTPVIRSSEGFDGFLWTDEMDDGWQPARRRKGRIGCPLFHCSAGKPPVNHGLGRSMVPDPFVSPIWGGWNCSGLVESGDLSVPGSRSCRAALGTAHAGLAWGFFLLGSGSLVSACHWQ